MGIGTIYPGHISSFSCDDFSKLTTLCYLCDQAATQACDGEMPDGKGTCDASMCKTHAVRFEAKDYCHIHKPEERPLIPEYGRKVEL